MDVILQGLEKVNLNDQDWAVPEEVCAAFDQYLLDSLLPRNVAFHDRPPNENDFEDFVPSVESKLQFVKNYLTKLVSIKFEIKNENLKLKKNTVVLVLMLCGEHTENKPWSSEQCQIHAADILHLTYQLCGCSKLQELLVHEKMDGSVKLDPLFKPVLLALRPKLLKDTWKAYPAAVSCFSWILPHVKSPHLSDHMDSVLPTALILVDDYEPVNRLLGIKCLHHIVDNVPRTQLCWYGQAEVVYQALFRMLYFRDELLAAPLLDCVILVVEKIESGPDAKDCELEWTRRDDVAQLVLQQMELEQKLALRAAYAGALPAVARALGPALPRWARRFTRVVRFYLENAPYDRADTTAAVLQAVEVLAALRRDAWCAEGHAPALSAALLRLLADATGAGAVDDASAPHLASLVAPAARALRAVLAAAPRTARTLARALRPAPARAPPALAQLLDEVLAPFAPAPDDGEGDPQARAGHAGAEPAPEAEA